ncbi:MAG TPA: hypothetical protein VHQ47_18910 [Phycisphaerae bacterium]|nr:hypothetical protein [Phycisphaerae bacterium]
MALWLEADVGFLSRVVHRVNEGLGSLPVRAAGNHFMKRYGHMTSLKIDSAARTIDAELMLKGETGPILISLANYSLEEGTFRAQAVRINREWMQLVAEDVLAKGVAVPGDLGKWLGMVL